MLGVILLIHVKREQKRWSYRNQRFSQALTIGMQELVVHSQTFAAPVIRTAISKCIFLTHFKPWETE